MTSKVALSTCLIIFIALSIFSIFQFTFSDSLSTRQRVFYEQDFDPTVNKILLLGSSHVGQINATHVNFLISQKIPNTVVFNLAESSNLPSKRLSSVDKILKLEPSIVVYGVSYRDFSDKSEINKDALLPEPKKIIHDNISFVLRDIRFDFLDNPKLVTLNTIRGLLNTNLSDSSTELFEKNTPFFPYDDLENNMITDISEIEKNYDKDSVKINIDLNNNPEIDSLEKIIDIFQQNGIRVILFSTPNQKFYTDLVPNSEKESFNSILQNISKKYTLDVYYLENKYSTLNIWSSTNHIAHNTNSMIYSEDIAKMVLEESD